MIYILGLAILLFSVILFFGFPIKAFGKLPKKVRLERIKNSPNYIDGNFQNLTPTDPLLKEASIWKILDEFFNKPDFVKPKTTLPSVKTDLKLIDTTTPTIVWFGHSSYLIKSKSVTILVDPVMSGYASPFSFIAKAFKGSNVYQVEDLPTIDIVLITHDHYDHLDYQTITKIITKKTRFCTSIGVGSHLEYWGVNPENISELDWFENLTFNENTVLTALPARHFSGRGIKRAQSLWSSFALTIDGFKLYLGGDSGYDTHFEAIGQKYGPFDLAILEAGQFGKYWPFIHMFPEQTIKAAQELKAKVLMPVHWGKFALSMHNWNDPIEKVVLYAKEGNLAITTPLIGEPVLIGGNYPQTEWWKL